MTGPGVVDELDRVLPDYEGRALGNVLPSVGAAVGLSDWQNVLGLPEALRYVVVLVDGLGHRLLERHQDRAPYLSSLLDGTEPMVCGLPSTTATSLTSLGTALPPGRHGVVGYTCRIPGTDRLLNALKWDRAIDAHDWQPHPNAFERLAESGIPASIVNKSEFAHSGLTLCSQRGVPFHGVDSVWERLDVVTEVCEAESQSVVYAYESTLDHTGHQFGSESVEWAERLSAIDAQLREMRETLPDDAAMLVTSDHGMVDLPLAGRFDVDREPELLADVVLLGGEARFRHLYVRAGAADAVAALWRDRLQDRAVVVTREEAEAAGWFGAIEDHFRPRIGDVLVAALGDFAVFSSGQFGIEMKMRGFHGSLTAEEMLIPLLVDL